jgi:small subunit ribosomal protein S1
MNTGTEEQKSVDEGGPEQKQPSQDLGKFLTEEYAVVEPKYGDLCKGVVITADESGLLVDFGFKREGFVPAEDLEHLDDEMRAAIHPGAEVPVFVVRARTRDGLPSLSIQQAQQFEHWIKAEEMLSSSELYEGEVAGCNRGGLIVRFGDIRGFVPTSQVVGMPRRLAEDERRRRLEAMVGRQVGLRVIEVDRGRRRLIFSQRRAYREWQERRRQQTMSELTEGETCHGIVTDLTSFGAFVDLGGADGLVHVSELSWRRVNHPREVLSVGQEVDVYVLGVDRQRKRIALSLKRLQPDPWTIVDQEYGVGQLVSGRVTRVLDFGAFVELDMGVEGLLHVSEMLGTPELQPADVVKPKDDVVLKIIRIDSGRKRIGLSAKQVRQNEWERWMMQQQEREAVEAAAAKAAAAEQPKAEEEPTATVVAPDSADAPAAEVQEAQAELAQPFTEPVPVDDTPVPEVDEDAPSADSGSDDQADDAPPPVDESVAEAIATDDTPAPEIEEDAPAPDAGSDGEGEETPSADDESAAELAEPVERGEKPFVAALEPEEAEATEGQAAESSD